MTPNAAPRVEVVAAYVGPDRLWRLRMWAKRTADALGCDSAVLVGSAVLGKDWRDLDVRFTFGEGEGSRWQKVEPMFRRDAWWATCAAFSAHATAVVGAPVDVQFTAKPQGPAFDLTEAQDG